MLMLLEQILNGLQYSALLFLLASGLTLVFGIMNVVNLMHGSFYMVGAFCAAAAMGATGSFAAAILAALLGAGLYGLIVEQLVIRHFYRRNHLDQVLATLGLALFTNDLVSLIFGREPLLMSTPSFLSGSIQLLPGLVYPLVRLNFIAVGVLVALGLWWLISRTRIGMLVRAGVDDHEMVDALGVNIKLLYAGVFVLGAVLCGLAGVVATPLLALEIGMGERILITTFVVIVVGGVGSVSGALVGALLVGMTDALGRAYIPLLIGSIVPSQIADSLAAGLVACSIYILMALVLLLRPAGLLPPQR